jgi:hypothetical protein
MKVKIGRWGVSAFAVVVMATVPAIGAFATVIVPVTPRTGSLIEVGPVAADNGFPTWYRDKDGAAAMSRLELCMPVAPLTTDPFCAAPALPDPAEPLAYPTNYPDEMFYQMAHAEIVQPGMSLLVEMNLEGAYANGAVIAGDEMVFGRIRMRDKTVPDGEIWRVTHPYGVDEITASDGKGMNMTQDVGTVAGAFGGALGGRIGPFLKWDPTFTPIAPAGYTGDPAVDHRVVGSPYGTNFLRVERKAGTTWTKIAETNLFSVQGRYSTNSGVDVPRAVYSLPATGPATIDVFATSEVGQSIQVGAQPALGIATTTLRGQQGRYFGRIPFTAPLAGLPLGATVDVLNAGDKPVATKTAKLTDLVTISSATYTEGAVGGPAPANTLVVTASSSDGRSAPVLTVTGFGPLVAKTGTLPASASFPVMAPPSTITVTSSRGGSATIATSVLGVGLDAMLPVAAFTAPGTVSLGQSVVLDAAPSTGGPLTYEWAQLAGTGAIIPAMNMSTPTLTFTPTTVGTYVLQLVVRGPVPPGLVSVPTSRTITVTPAVAGVTANAGPAQTVQRGKVVTLDASATRGAQSLSWTQLSGPTVTLSSTSATAPTFSYVRMPLPNATVGSLNPNYVSNNLPLTFRVTATGVGGVGTSSATVVITPQPESITRVLARYRTIGDWRVTGSTSNLAGQRITVVLGPNATGRTIGSATVDSLGNFAVRAFKLPDPRVPAPDATVVTVVSAAGGIATSGLTITN